MNDPLRSYSVVLLGRYPGKDLAVAQALTTLLGRDETWGLRVVSAAPIILFEKFSRQESAYLLNVLSSVADAGCRFEVQEGSNSTYPKVGWSVPAKLNGVPLAEVCAEAAAMPPLPVTVNGPQQSDGPSTPLRGTAKIPLPNVAFNNAQPTPTQPQMPIQPAHTYATLYLPCPYTGQTMKLTLDVMVARVENAGTVSISAQAAPAFSPAARPAKSGTIVLPTARRSSVSGAIATANLETAHAPLASGVSSTVAPTVSRPHSSSHSLPAPSWKRKTPPEGLPDVPVLPSHSLVGAAGEAVSHMPSGGQPMDLSDFEQSLGMTPGHERPLIDPGASNIYGEPTSSGELDAMLLTGEGKEVLCSIFIERSSSPVVHELVAELHGIPEPEAAQMCVSGRTALAENIPLEEAVEIKRRCAEINVMARIITHR